MHKFDALIIGGGIIGLATALQLLRKKPQLSVAILEKEKTLAFHQTGHNSGVIHSGIYYKPGSLKAKNCREGVKALKSFCLEKGIPFKTIGKVILALNEEELPRLQELERRGKANGVPGLRCLSKEELKEIEPYATGIAALYSPETGVIDFVQVAEAYAKEVLELGGQIFLSQKVVQFRNESVEKVVVTADAEFGAQTVINCAGVHADRIGQLFDPQISAKQIIPFRGEYYELVPEKRELIKGLIYPVPDPKFPFLGVHLSRTIDGKVEAGPNAVLALSREGYSKADCSFRDIKDYLTYKGFWQMALRYWKVGAYELYRSFSKRAFLSSLQKLVPSLTAQDLIPTESGVRSQVVLPDGKLQDDFLIVQKPGVINVLNAPSPAATSSLAIGEAIANLV